MEAIKSQDPRLALGDDIECSPLAKICHIFSPTKQEGQIHRTPKKTRGIRPRVLLGGSFFLLILIGVLLLLTPWAQASGTWAWIDPINGWSGRSIFTSIVDNAFMGTSAACVTGLSVFSLADHYTFFGQIILLIMVQLGGIGIMTLGSFFIMITGLRLSTHDETAMMLTFGTKSRETAHTIVLKTVRYVLAFESIGIALLYWRYHFHYGYEVADALWYATFHAISAFCNAGLSLHNDNLMGFVNDPCYLLTVGGLIVLGGLGFLVLSNLFQIKWWSRNWTTRGRTSLHTKIVLRTTFWLLVIGTLFFAIFEWDGVLAPAKTLELPKWWDSVTHWDWDSLKTLVSDVGRRLYISLFHAISPRTAGFNAVPMSEISQAGNFVTSVLMLIGGSPGSMAGGIKTTTVVVLCLTTRAMIRGRQETETGKRTLPFTVVREATVIFSLYLMMVFLTYFALLLTEQAIIQKGGIGLLFEVISAYGTVGLSIDNTTLLTYFGRCVITTAMFIGRLGPITIALIIGAQKIQTTIRYPEENINVG